MRHFTEAKNIEAGRILKIFLEKIIHSFDGFLETVSQASHKISI